MLARRGDAPGTEITPTKVARAKVAKARRIETHVSRCLGRVPVRPYISQICRYYPCLREHLAIGLMIRLHGTPVPA